LGTDWIFFGVSNRYNWVQTSQWTCEQKFQIIMFKSHFGKSLSKVFKGLEGACCPFGMNPWKALGVLEYKTIQLWFDIWIVMVNIFLIKYYQIHSILYKCKGLPRTSRVKRTYLAIYEIKVYEKNSNLYTKITGCRWV